MQIRPILVALRRHRIATFLIALEIALACAVLCNACFLIVNRINAMHIVSGVDESSLAYLSLEGYDRDHVNDLNARVVAGISAIPGVRAVGVLNSIPFGDDNRMNGITIDPARQRYNHVINTYAGDAQSLRALGLHLVAGRMPTADDYRPVVSGFVPRDSLVLITRSLADSVWPGEDPLGKDFWCIDFHFRVMGVIDHLTVPEPENRLPTERDFSAFVPAISGNDMGGTYVIQADPRELPHIFREVMLAIPKIAPEVVVDHDGSGLVSDLRERYFRNDRAMVGILLGVIAALMMVTALGIVGLASFWVQQRRKQIGIRRAIGATRGDILRYFQTENFLIVTMGVMFGFVLAYALNLILMKSYEVSHLPIGYLLTSSVVLWLLGQLAVLGPALRAAAVPPVVATRSV